MDIGTKGDYMHHSLTGGELSGGLMEKCMKVSSSMENKYEHF